MKNKIKENTYTLVTKDNYLDSAVQATAKKNKQNLAIVDKSELERMAKQQSDSQTQIESKEPKQPSSSNNNVYETDIDAVIEPQDQETIKYLSNVKDPNTGKISQPFTIGDKKYQMVRGMKPSREIVLGVLCLNEMNEDGSGNKIYSVDHFDKTVATPMKEKYGNGNMNSPEDKKELNTDKEKFIDHLNLSDMNGFRHFFVNRQTNEVTGKFKSIGEMIKSGTKLGLEEDYMDAKQLKRRRYENYFKPTMNEADDDVDGTDVNKLKTDVKKLTKLISAKFSTAISKIDKPIEQVEFLSAMAEIIGVPFNKLTSLINSFKDVANQQKTAEPAPVMEDKKIINKDSLLESLGVKQEIIKLNKTKNGK